LRNDSIKALCYLAGSLVRQGTPFPLADSNGNAVTYLDVASSLALGDMKKHWVYA